MSADSSARRRAVERRQLGRLEDERVAGGQRGPELPGRHVERVVPRGDAGAHAEGVAPQHRGVVLEVLAGRLGLQGAGGAGEEPEVVDGQVELEVDDRHGLADVAPSRARFSSSRLSSMASARASSFSLRSRAWCAPRWRTPRPRRRPRRRRRRRRSTAPRRSTSPVAGSSTSSVAPVAGGLPGPADEVLVCHRCVSHRVAVRRSALRRASPGGPAMARDSVAGM